ncbi:hypothetical protein OG625_33545 [Streptomyces sp. NBC_01351]|uniref:hypothetical protein n=1 Tax=Streptomyces sp. NBC_01351 TaxID=2903833 RepID=UPI002E376E7A|nr:hypothetical protein [Streptomyces sp. NBC_01351]
MVPTPIYGPRWRIPSAQRHLLRICVHLPVIDTGIGWTWYARSAISTRHDFRHLRRLVVLRQATSACLPTGRGG